MLFLNISAGLGLISQMSPIAQDLFKPLADASLSPEDLVKVLAVAGGSVVAYSAIFNGLGRLFWARVSDTIGRKSVFAIMFASQAVIYALVAMGIINGYYLFLVSACYLVGMLRRRFCYYACLLRRFIWARLHRKVLRLYAYGMGMRRYCRPARIRPA